MKIYTATITEEALRVRSEESSNLRQKRLFYVLVAVATLMPLLLLGWTSGFFYYRAWSDQAMRIVLAEVEEGGRRLSVNCETIQKDIEMDCARLKVKELIVSQRLTIFPKLKEAEWLIAAPSGACVLLSSDGKASLTEEERGWLNSDGPNIYRSRNDFILARTILGATSLQLVVKTLEAPFLENFNHARKLDLLVVVGTSVALLTIASLVFWGVVARLDRADEQRKEMYERIRQARRMALIGRVSAGVAHEINNPLQIIGDQAGWISELLEDPDERQAENRDEYRNAVDKIKTQVRRAKNITHRLLGFCRNESGQKEIDLNTLVKDTVDMVTRDADERRITIELKLLPGLPVVVTDASQLQQVFLNILKNGIDAVDHDGRIKVRTFLDRRGRITVEFADSGPGMSQQTLNRLFDPFFTTKKNGKGNGIGLWMSYNIMQALQGGIHAKNGEEEGSVFTVMLPQGRHA